MSGKAALPDLEVHMALTVILAVGLDPLLGLAQSAAWKSAGYIVVSVATIKKAIDHFRAGDFDLVLLGNAISLESKERLTFLIRSFGSHTPVICIANTSGDRNCFADATLNNDSSEFLKGIEDLLAKTAKMTAELTTVGSKLI
jgi:DNA-binding response OmpR family regulator